MRKGDSVRIKESGHIGKIKRQHKWCGVNMVSVEYFDGEYNRVVRFPEEYLENIMEDGGKNGDQQ